MSPLLYCIEGNIGAGKSTVLEALEKKKYPCFPERIYEWTLLEKFYEDPDTYIFPFHYQILLSQYNQLLECQKFPKNREVFMERHPWTSRNIFIDMLDQKGIWSESNSKCYDNLYTKIPVEIDIMFFLNVDYKKCYERIQKRNRTSEVSKISLDYLFQLELEYEQKLLWQSSQEKLPFKVVEINATEKTPEEIVSLIEDVLLENYCLY